MKSSADDVQVKHSDDTSLGMINANEGKRKKIIISRYEILYICLI